MIVTSFSQKGFHQYGKDFIETFLQNWKDETLLVYYERGIPSDAPQDERVTYVNLYRFDDFVKFEQLILASHPVFRGICNHPKSDQPLYNFRFDVNRFFRKVYAITDAYFNHRHDDDDFIAWIDADVRFEKEIPADFLKSLIPDDKAIAHINREWLYTEAGFMLFRTDHALMEMFMVLYKAAYFNGSFRYLAEMHDCYVFDFITRLIEIPRHSLAKNEHSDHPFQECELGEYMTHLKGPDRKRTGALLETDPKRQIA